VMATPKTRGVLGDGDTKDLSCHLSIHAMVHVVSSHVLATQSHVLLPPSPQSRHNPSLMDPIARSCDEGYHLIRHERYHLIPVIRHEAYHLIRHEGYRWREPSPWARV